LHGWVYDIKTGEVVALDGSGERFIPVEDRYAREIARNAVGRNRNG
jgi:carbonic anhydrase